MNFLLLSTSFRTGLLLLHNLCFSYFHNKYEYSQTSILQSFLCSPVSFFEHFMSDGRNNSTGKRVCTVSLGPDNRGLNVPVTQTTKWKKLCTILIHARQSIRNSLVLCVCHFSTCECKSYALPFK